MEFSLIIGKWKLFKAILKGGGVVSVVGSEVTVVTDQSLEVIETVEVVPDLLCSQGNTVESLQTPLYARHVEVLVQSCIYIPSQSTWGEFYLQFYVLPTMPFRQ